MGKRKCISLNIKKQTGTSPILQGAQAFHHHEAFETAHDETDLGSMAWKFIMAYGGYCTVSLSIIIYIY